MKTLEEIRKSQNKSREWLADQLQVSWQTIYNWEKGKKPSYVSQIAIATILNVSLDSISFE